MGSEYLQVIINALQRRSSQKTLCLKDGVSDVSPMIFVSIF